MTFSQGPQFSHRTGQAWTVRWTPDLVANADDPDIALASYMQQVLGIGFPTLQDITTLRKQIKQVLEYYPQATYHTMCRVVQYYRTNRAKRGYRRASRVYQVIALWRDALADGALPELTHQQFDQRIAEILEHETDPGWRARLIGVMHDDTARDFVLDEWASEHVEA